MRLQRRGLSHEPWPPRVHSPATFPIVQGRLCLNRWVPVFILQHTSTFLERDLWWSAEREGGGAPAGTREATPCHVVPGGPAALRALGTGAPAVSFLCPWPLREQLFNASKFNAGQGRRGRKLELESKAETRVFRVSGAQRAQANGERCLGRRHRRAKRGLVSRAVGGGSRDGSEW